MCTMEFNRDKGQITGFLASLPKVSAARMICLLAIGAISVIRKDYSEWPKVEKLVFTSIILFFCRYELADRDLVELINTGIQIEDLKEFTDDPVRFARITEDVKAGVLQLFSRDETVVRRSNAARRRARHSARPNRRGRTRTGSRRRTQS